MRDLKPGEEEVLRAAMREAGHAPPTALTSPGNRENE